MYLFFKILFCALAGFAIRFPADALAKILLKKREKALEEGKAEKIILSILLTGFGGLIGWKISGIPEIVFCLLMLGVLTAVTVCDYHFRIIPNDLVLAVFGLTLVFGIPYLFLPELFPVFRPVSALIGMVLCFLIFLLPGIFGKSVGMGDVKLASAIGFALGLTNSLAAIVLMGVLVLVFTVVQRKLPLVKVFQEMIPMGPFISLACVVILILRGSEPLLSLGSILPY